MVLEVILFIFSLICPMFQGLLMIFDEFFYHWRRGLPRWERIGHPFDTMTIVLCFGYAYMNKFTEKSVLIFAVFGVFSCFFVTKDEFVHAKKCKPGEQWLHALLFVIHPLVIFSYGCLWWLRNNPSSLAQNLSYSFLFKNQWFLNPNFLDGIMLGQLFIVTMFGFYQVIYWNFICKDKRNCY